MGFTHFWNSHNNPRGGEGGDQRGVGMGTLLCGRGKGAGGERFKQLGSPRPLIDEKLNSKTQKSCSVYFSRSVRICFQSLKLLKKY